MPGEPAVLKEAVAVAGDPSTEEVPAHGPLPQSPSTEPAVSKEKKVEEGGQSAEENQAHGPLPQPTPAEAPPVSVEESSVPKEAGNEPASNIPTGPLSLGSYYGAKRLVAKAFGQDQSHSRSSDSPSEDQDDHDFEGDHAKPAKKFLKIKAAFHSLLDFLTRGGLVLL